MTSEASVQEKSTRDHLIEVGLDLMRRRGYGATGLQEILQAAGVPKGSFYHHFGSKEEFAAAVIGLYGEQVGEHGGRVLGNARLAPLKRLRRYFEELIEMAGQSSPTPGCLVGSLSLEMAAVSTLLQAKLSAGFQGWQSAVAGVLREAVQRGDLPASTKLEPLAGFILNSWEGALLRSQAEKSDLPLKEFLHFVFDNLLAK
jgi:TetR/AcrR family transcriptional repressor of nem operon